MTYGDGLAYETHMFERKYFNKWQFNSVEQPNPDTQNPPPNIPSSPLHPKSVWGTISMFEGCDGVGNFDPTTCPRPNADEKMKGCGTKCDTTPPPEGECGKDYLAGPGCKCGENSSVGSDHCCEFNAFNMKSSCRWYPGWLSV